jgi:hypothetical protein
MRKIQMGDRANVFVKDEGYSEPNSRGVYLYTHWGGEVLPHHVQVALKRKQRWDDGPYLTRIIFCTMIKGQEDEETGFGISGSLCDGENAIITINIREQTISFGKAKKWKLDEYVKLTEDEISEAWQKAR